MSRGDTEISRLATSLGRNVQLSIAMLGGSEFIKNKILANNKTRRW